MVRRMGSLCRLSLLSLNNNPNLSSYNVTHHCKCLHLMNLPRIHPRRSHSFHQQCCSGRLHRWTHSHTNYDHYIGKLRKDVTASLVRRILSIQHTWTDFKEPPFMHFFITVSHTEAGVPGSREAAFTALTKTCV